MSRVVGLVVAGALLVACGSTDGDVAGSVTTTTVTSPIASEPAPATTSSTTPPPTATTLPVGVAPRPAWLGTRVLPADPATGFGRVEPTPPELVDRRLATPDHLPRPTSTAYTPAVGPVPDDVVARSTWTDECPVGLADLRYVTLPFVGFDGEVHTGELLLHADAVDAVVAGFGHLYERGFPIEEMRVVRADELDLPPTGDGNNTSAFVCRPSVGSSSWSQHAYGRAVDVNPFHNPYVRGEVVLPELASAYVDRAAVRPGMLAADDVAGFTGAGWGWGGAWSSAKDWMHLSASGR